MHSSLAFLLLTGSAVAQTLFPAPPEHPANPTTPDKVLLGKALFWDEQLSSTRTVACGTCHVFGHGGADPRAGDAVHPGPDGVFDSLDDTRGSPGVPRHTANGSYVASPFGIGAQTTPRRAPSVINAAYATELFADGRAGEVFRDPLTQAIVLPYSGALESQVASPLVNPTEMAHIGRTWADVAAELPALTPLALASNLPTTLQQFVAGRDYDQLFTQVFGSPGVTPVRIAFALAAYERTLVSDQSPYDLWLAGQGTLTTQQTLGLAIFATRCFSCHTDLAPSVLATGPLDEFRNIGVRPPAEDPGRAAVTGKAGDRGRFRVPGLRNVALRAPYFHNGGMPGLVEVIEFYARGGDFADNRDPLVAAIQGHISPLDNALLRALLGALTDPRVANELPPFDRPTLWSEGPAAHAPFGAGTAVAGAPALHIGALTPARLGSPLTLGADGFAPGQPTALLLDAVGGAPTSVLGHETFLGLSPALVIASMATTVAWPNGGVATTTLAIPAAPAVAGTWWLQWLALDPNGPAGLATSPTLRLTIY